MQTPALISSDNNNNKIYYYSQIERISNGFSFADFTSTTEKSVVTSGFAGTDPVIKLPNIGSKIKIKFNPTCYWIFDCSGPPLRQLTLDLIAYNKIFSTGPLITIDGVPLTAQLNSQSELFVDYLPQIIDFSQFSVLYAIPSCFDGNYWMPSAGTNNYVCVRLCPVITVYGTN